MLEKILKTGMLMIKLINFDNWSSQRNLNSQLRGSIGIIFNYLSSPYVLEATEDEQEDEEEEGSYNKSFFATFTVDLPFQFLKTNCPKY